MLIQATVTRVKGAAFEIEELELEELRGDEVLVRVVACGICHTDLIIRDQWHPGPLPAVRGHEGAGVVEAVGASVRKVAPGDHVAMSYGSCGSCHDLAAGRPWVCHDFWGRNFAATRPDGSTALAGGGGPIHSHFFGQSSFATHALATERNVTRLDPDVPLEVVAPFGCGIQTGAGAAERVAAGRRVEHRRVRHRDRRPVGRDRRPRGRLHDDRRDRCAPRPARARRRAGRHGCGQRGRA
jgi:aryl-alcohol dehydrogenase